jgi:N-acetylglucosamine-6-sulfatase
LIAASLLGRLLPIGRVGAVAAMTALAALAATWASRPPASAAAGDQGRPNIILVVTDDQTLAQLSAATMPNTLELIGAQGTTFTNAIATTPLCCPSRASMLTGQYGHNNGVLANRPGYGALSRRQSTLPAWLRAAGYRTAHVGRWLNGYRKAPGDGAAPGWDEWFTIGESQTYFGYKINRDGEEIRFRKGPRDYLTRVLNQAALRLIRRHVRDPRPFFLQLDHLAPHGDGAKGEKKGACAHSAIPPSRAPVGFESVPLPEPPSFGEADIGDKPSFVKVRPPLSAGSFAELQRQYRCRLASLPAVDEGVRRIVETLDKLDELDDTAIVFVSDNGYFFGEHRVPNEKYLAYEEAVHIPLLIRFPAGVAPAGTTIDAAVANIDLAPTLLKLAGAKPCARGACRVMDGRSLVAPAQGQVADWPQDRALVIELARAAERPNTNYPCTYAGVRVAGQVYVEHTSVPNPVGECQPAFEVEHYDLAADPFQLQNLFPAPPASPAAEAQAQLAERLAALRDCAGIAGRDPLPASGHYCE